MSAEGRHWLVYAQENLRAPTMCLEGNLFNPCLQNAQQAIENALKALHLASGLSLKKTHSIGEFRGDLLRAKADPGLPEEAAELLDTSISPRSIPLVPSCRTSSPMSRWRAVALPSLTMWFP
jgi:HEPN domain-containing protein